MQIDQITGNQKAKDFLKKLLHSQQKPHALLFEGIEGIGKKLFAQAFAQILLCENKNACGICTHCNRFKDNIHPDYFFIEPEMKKDSKIKKDTISIDQIRFLLKETAYPPKLSKHRVVIIDGMELLTIEASNSILKLLEEPPNGWLFLLITSSIDKLLPTITSRTTLIKFYPLNKIEVATFLEKNNHIEIDNIKIASSLANGSIGLAYRYGNKDAEKIRQYALTFSQKALQGNYLDAINDLEKMEREEALLYLEYMTMFIRDAWQIKYNNSNNLWNKDLKNSIKNIFNDFTIVNFKNILKEIDIAWFSLKKSANVRLIMEGFFISLSEEKEII